MLGGSTSIVDARLPRPCGVLSELAQDVKRENKILKILNLAHGRAQLDKALSFVRRLYRKN